MIKLSLISLACLATCSMFACGGGSSSDASSGSSSGDTSSGGNSSGGVSSGGPTGQNETKLVDGAHIRVVNLYSAAIGQPLAAMDIRIGAIDSERDLSAPVANAVFGGVSGYFTPSLLGASIYDAAKPGSAGQVKFGFGSRRGYKRGERVTLVLHARDDSSGPSLASYELDESKADDGTGSSFDPAPGLAAVGITSTAAAGLDARGVPTGFYLGAQGQPGCFGGDGLIGGTTTEFFVFPPGATTLKLHNAIGCADQPSIPPIVLNLTAGSRTWIVIGGTGPGDLRGVVIPVTENP